jgi:excisionase family DNA binding protein
MRNDVDHPPDPEPDLLLSLERTINTAGQPYLVELLGGLERLKAILWQRLVSVTLTRTAPLAIDSVEELRHLTPQQVAESLSLKAAYVHELCRTGRIPATKSGKYWMIPVAGLRRWLAYRNRDVDGAAQLPVQSLNARGDTRPPSLTGPAGRQRRSLMT